MHTATTTALIIMVLRLHYLKTAPTQIRLAKCKTNPNECPNGYLFYLLN